MLRIRRAPAIVASVLLALFAFLFLVYAPMLPKPSAAKGPLDARRFVAEQEDHVRRIVTDPESARLRDEFVSTNRDDPLVCGWVNVRNALGGYDGFRRFVAGNDVVAFDGESPVAEFDATWRERCATLAPTANPTRTP